MEGRKELLWIVNKESFGQKQGFWFVKMEFFADSRLRGVEMGGGGQKRVALDGNKKGLCERKTFGL